MKKVALLGRPNVGKSSLFNTLVRKQEAIVSAKENMTRDVKYGVVKERALSYQLVDMGGLTDGKGDFLDLVNEKVRDEVASSDLVIVLFDIRDVRPDDKRALDFARKSGRPFLAVANKADEESVEQKYLEIHALKLKDFIAVSSKNLRNISGLRKKIVEILDDGAQIKGQKKEKNITVSILGRPNVGKSSLLNLLLGKERAIVSPVSGTTRDSVDGVFTHNGRAFRIIDTAGIRKKSRKKSEEEEKSLKKSIRSSEEADIVLLMIDAREGLGMQDKKIAQTVKTRNKPIVLVVNKWDLSPYSWKEYQKSLTYAFPILSSWSILPISCHTKKGVDELKDALIEIYKNNNVAFERKELGMALKEALLRQPSPQIKGKRLKIHAWKQVSRGPIIIELLVNSIAYLNRGYIAYLTRSIKSRFHLEKTDVKLSFKEKAQK